jgi:cytochrome c556
MDRKVIVMRLVAAAIALSSSVSPAHEGATGIVKERMDAMTQAGKAMKEAGERIKAKRDLPAIKDDARTVTEVAARIVHEFPRGSDQHPTDAKPEIWARWDDFAARAGALEREGDALAAAVDSGDPGAIARQFRTVGRVCGDCHDLYRIKR